jgi:hypothetical protein
MTDDQLERELRDHYRAIDPAMTPPRLSHRIDQLIEQEGSRPGLISRIRPAFGSLVGVAAVIAIGLALAIRFGGLISPIGSSPSPAPSATPGTPAPSGSVPPISTAPWSSLGVRSLPGGPLGVASVVPWAGGYLALGSADGSSVPAWASADGRSWTAVATDAFGPASLAEAAACGDGLLVAVADADGHSSVFRSTDGRSWTLGAAPQLRLAGGGGLAGGATGVVAIAATAASLAVSTDCVTWQAVTLPDAAGATANAVAAFGPRFVVVGDPSGAGESPVAWNSADGRTWTAAQVEPRPGDGFDRVWSGADGLVATSTQPGVTPGVSSMWTSKDGSHWAPSSADPLGTFQGGAGAGSVNGVFQGDGTRLLVFGSATGNRPYGYWTSLDGSSWTQLTLTGDGGAPDTGEATPFLLRDGILWSGDQGAWFGQVGP